MWDESSRRSAARVLAAVPPGPPRPLGPRAPLLGRVVAERLPDELVLVDGTSAPAAPQSPLLGVNRGAKVVDALLRDLGRGRVVAVRLVHHTSGRRLVGETEPREGRLDAGREVAAGHG